MFDKDGVSEYKDSADGDSDGWDYKTSKEIQEEIKKELEAEKIEFFKEILHYNRITLLKTLRI